MKKLVFLACAAAVVLALTPGGAQAAQLFTETWTVGDGPVNGQANVTGDSVTYAVTETFTKGATADDVTVTVTPDALPAGASASTQETTTATTLDTAGYVFGRVPQAAVDNLII